MPWIIDDVEDKIQTALGMDQLSCLNISDLQSKSWVANEFIDVLTCYDLADNGLEMLVLKNIYPECEPFEEEAL